MKYTAYITRFYQMAEESLEVIIDNVPDFETFKSKVYAVFSIIDYRANLQGHRLFEDTTLTNELTYDELQKVRKAVDIIFPETNIARHLDLNGPQDWAEETRNRKGGFQFSKNSGDGEILKVFLHEMEPVDDVNVAIKNIYTLIDARLKRTNDRKLKLDAYMKTLTMEMRLKLQLILDLLYKRTEVAHVISRLRGQEAQETVDSMRAEIFEEQNNAS